ncbi:MAG: Ceramide glucosyltransferase, partial [Labilithrix sp.]|nr:Ceramide glucosyltransferase [Labilithrix sp.]
MIATVPLVAWALGYAGASLTALRPRPAPSRGLREPGVLLMRPLAGADAGQDERLLETGGASRVVFAVGHEADPACASARAAAHVLGAAGVDARVVVTNASGPNHKADQLARALARVAPSPRTPVAFVDADVDLTSTDLADAAGHLSRSVGAAWLPPVERGAVRTLGDALSHAVMNASLHAFPLLARIDPNGLVGKVVLVRKGTLDDLGGFEALREHLGEDMALARGLRARGLRSIALPGVATATATGRSTRDVLARFTRWLLVIRLQRPLLLVSYPLLLAPLPFFVAALVLALAAGARGGALAMTLALVVRVVVAMAARRAAGLPAS